MRWSVPLLCVALLISCGKDPVDDRVDDLAGADGGLDVWNYCTYQESRHELVKMGEAAVPALTRGLSHKQAMVREMCADILPSVLRPGSGGLPRETRLALLACLGDEAPGVRAEAASALGKLAPRDPEVLTALTGMTGDVDATTRMCVVNAIGCGQDASATALPLLLAALDDPYYGTRSEAVLAAAAVAPDPMAILPHLIRMLRDVHRLPASSAAQAIGTLGPAAAPAVDDLMALLAAPNTPLGGEAAEALGRIGVRPREVLPALAEALQAGGGEMQIINAIQRYGEEARSILPAIRDALHHDDWFVRTVAKEIVDSLDESGE